MGYLCIDALSFHRCRTAANGSSPIEWMHVHKSHLFAHLNLSPVRCGGDGEVCAKLTKSNGTRTQNRKIVSGRALECHCVYRCDANGERARLLFLPLHSFFVSASLDVDVVVVTHTLRHAHFTPTMRVGVRGSGCLSLSACKRRE